MSKHKYLASNIKITIKIKYEIITNNEASTYCKIPASIISNWS